jgi:glucose/arabinose dehydrogenase
MPVDKACSCAESLIMQGKIRHSLLGCVILLGLAGFGLAQAATQIKSQRVAAGLSAPLFVCAPPGDSKRLFIVEQNTGQIRILDLSSGQINATPFLRVTGITSGGERGLLGLAFHPNYAANGHFYVNYTASGGGAAGHTEITRFTAQGDPATSNAADAATKSLVLRFDQPESNHNGGWVGFGPDGFLYVATGDGGGANDLHGSTGSGQNRNTLLGKILRIDVNGGSTYGIPDGNPFKGDTTKREEIWAFGLRNPWRCSFDRQTGDLWIGDVGQGAREEIDFIPAGAGGLNFGWRPREGLIQTPAYPNESPVTSATHPVHDYGRSSGVSVTGGYVYRGTKIPGLQGSYLFGDYQSARLWSFTLSGSGIANLQERTAELNSGTPKPIGSISSFGEDAAGELYICDYSGGEIYKIVSAVSALAISQAAIVGEEIRFSFEAEAGQTYTVESRDSLFDGNWQTVSTFPAPATATTLQVANPITPGQRFYRVRMQ